MLKYRIARGIARSKVFALFMFAVGVAILGIALVHFLVIPLLAFLIAIIWGVAANQKKQGGGNGA